MVDPLPHLPPGRPNDRGACAVAGGVRFGVFAPDADALELCVFDATGTQEQARYAFAHQEGGVWHATLPGASAGLVYGLRAHGPWRPHEGLRFNPQRVLLDPYAREVVGRYGGDLNLYLGHDAADASRPHPEDNAAVALKARVVAGSEAALLSAWHPPEPRNAGQRVIAEVHVKAATQSHPGIPAAMRGSYAGLAHPVMVAHWKRLGVTTLELLPLQQRADEARLLRMGLSNHWGYSPLAYFAAEPRYAQHHADAELRAAIATLRAEGFEVVLDVVLNHTAELNEWGPCLSFRGLANRHYYRLDPADGARYLNWSGCGNSLNLTEPAVLRWALDGLRHWMLHFGVDGFRFDLGVSLGRDVHGGFSARAAFLAALQADPVLRHAVLIAEPWDLGPDGHRVGAFGAPWLEWNDGARDSVRAYWLAGRGSAEAHDARAQRAAIAHTLAGSSDRFAARGRGAQASVNFITAHDGFTLADLVAYDERRNHANGEDGRDGHGDNLSWAAPQPWRAPLQRALLATLMLSRGTPMLLGGDELGHSQSGNNNAYCQDNAITWWDWAHADDTLAPYIGHLAHIRRHLPAITQAPWWRGEGDVSWRLPNGKPVQGGDWHAPADRAMAVWLTAAAAPSAIDALLHRRSAGEHHWLMALNPTPDGLPFALPPSPSGAWHLWLDSSAPGSGTRGTGGSREPGLIAGSALHAPPYSVQLVACHPLPAAQETRR